MPTWSPTCRLPIFALSPDETELGGTPVEIHGINFDKDATVYFGARQVEIVYQDLNDANAQILQVIAPVGQAGQSVSVQVQNEVVVNPFLLQRRGTSMTLSNLIPPKDPMMGNNTVLLVGQTLRLAQRCDSRTSLATA